MRLLCEAAARRGMATIYPDLSGTGDSSGDFVDATWAAWRADVERAAAWLVEQGCTSLAVVGIRAGALLAWDMVTQTRLPITTLVLWQPVLNGSAVVTDLLRTCIANAAGRDSVSVLRQQLARGEPVEAAGYCLSAALASDLNAMRMDPQGARRAVPILWIEIVAEDSIPTRHAALEAASRLRAAGVTVTLGRQRDPPFWGTGEVTVGHAAIAETVRWLDSRP